MTRMDRPGICEDCRFWDNSVQSANAEPDTTGVCRRRAPSAVDDRTGRAQFPFTEDSDWCAEWQGAAYRVPENGA